MSDAPPPPPIPPVSRAPRGTVIVLGIMVWYPLAGVSYQFLHYLRGLRRLGYDVYYLEDTLANVYDPTINDYTSDARRNVGVVQRILERHGFADRWAYHLPVTGGGDPEAGGAWAGLPRERVLEVCRRADAVLNVTGAHRLRPEHLAIPRRIYVESDPFASQVRVAQGDRRTIDLLDPHTHFFTFGENLGRPSCAVPVERYAWRPTRQPVDLDLWSPPSPPGRRYTTITTWHNKGDGLEWRGERYWWTKDREFRRFLDLPRRSAGEFELACGVGEPVLTELRSHGWRIVDSVPISSEMDRYRDYIASSRAEFTVARDQYVRPRTGWFSDRSACYLAAGRPVITQDTGFGEAIPTGHGLFAFQTMDDILAAVDAIERDPEGHARSARQIAQEFFSADAVLQRLLEQAGLQ